MSTISHVRRRNKFTIEQLLLAFFFGFNLFFATLFIFYLGFQLLFIGKIYPGISVAGIDVSGMPAADAALRISQEYKHNWEGRVILSDGENKWVLTPADLGVIVDMEASAQNAFQIGRRGNPFKIFNDLYSSWYYGVDLPPALIYNENLASQYLSNLALEINQPIREPTIHLEGTDVIVQQGQTGRIINIPASLSLISSQMQPGKDVVVPLVVLESQPTILDIESQAKLAEEILSEPLVLQLPNSHSDQPGPWTIPPDALAIMLSFEPQNSNGNNQYTLTLNHQPLRNYLDGLSGIYQQAENSRFIFNDDTHQLEVIKPAVIGQQLNIDASLENIQDTLLNKQQHSAELILDTINPQVTDEMSGEELGITGLVQSEATYFYGSSPDRVQNITKAASEFHGLLIAPYEIFSMAGALGNISLDNGYAEALIIYGDQTIQGVGGGVCQVSTTLFRTAFFAGYPIIERHPHSYRVSYYERVAGGGRDDDLAGLDATVYVPLVDFKFQNDTPYWLLMETYINPSYNSIVWKFYSTDDGRTVDWRTTGPTNIIPAPETKYLENPELSAGETRKVDYKADGAEITVNRTVYLDGNVYLEDSIYTNYQPWAEVIEYGPGTEGYPPENGGKEEDQ